MATELVARPRPVARVASRSELDDVSRLLAAGFQDDPVPSWLFPDEDARRARLWRMFRVFVHEYGPHGRVYRLEDGTAAALWAPPGRWHFSKRGEARALATGALLLGRRLPRMMRLMEALESVHPEEPHYYLMLLATDPALRGRGLGRDVLRPVLERADAEGVGCYLESSNPRNIPFYERLGFRVTGRIAVPEGCPPVTPMWRDPQPTG